MCIRDSRAPPLRQAPSWLGETQGAGAKSDTRRARQRGRRRSCGRELGRRRRASGPPPARGSLGAAE
eukprot:11998440-Alexandrium_andersonii.AAC.1